MNFLNGDWFFLLLLLIPGVIALYLFAGRRRQKLVRGLLGAQADAPGAVCVSCGKRFVRAALFLLAAACLVTAAARPWWGTRPVPAATAGRDVLVLFDVSKSMLATDVAPSRLAHARYLVRELAERNRGDRFGIVAFAGTAYLACPLTSDTTGFIQYADELDTHTVPLGGTNLERALQTASEAFQAAEGNFRAVVLITDGDELAGDSSKMIDELKKKHIPLFVLGLGDPDVPALVPEKDGGYKRDAKGELVRTRLAEAQLKKLALATGGIYVRSTAAQSGIDLIDRRIKALAPAVAGNGTRSVPIERFPYALAAALALLAGFFLLSEKKFAVLLLCCAALSLAAADEPLPAKKTTGPTPEPAVRETDPVKLYNQARDLQSEGKPAAADRYARAIQYSGEAPEVRSRSFFNLGSASHRLARQAVRQAKQTLQAQQLDAARQTLEKAKRTLGDAEGLYRQALAQSSAGLDPGGNLQKLADDHAEIEKLLKKIEELKKQQQQARDQTQKAKDQNKRDQQKQDQRKQDQRKQDQRKQDQQSKPDQQNKQDQQSKQDQRKQDQRKQDQQKQDQRKQDRRDSSAEQQMRQAREAAEKLREQAQDLQQKKLADDAKQAAQDIREAEEARKKNDPAKADKHLADALRKLGDPGDRNRQDQQKQDQQGKQDKQDPDKQDKQDKLPQDRPSARPEPKPEPGRIDRESAEKLLKALAGQEKELRDAMKRRAEQRQYKVEKDW